MADLVAYARDAAVRAGINPDYFERQIRQESGFNPNAYNAQSGASGIAQIIPKYHPGVDVWNPEASLDYAASLIASYRATFGSYVKAFAAYNWGSGNVSHWDGKRSSLPAETQRYLDVILGPGWVEPGVPVPTYNPDVPLILQNDDWSCWATSARMALESWGRMPTEAWIEGQAIADGIESTALGLLDGTGAAGAAWITRQYSDPSEGTPTITAHNAASVTFDDVKSVAGQTAIMLGGHNWGTAGHWTFVRRYTPATDSLELGNPAGTYAGVGQVMSRQQFASVAPCSMIVVTADGAVVPPPVVVPPATDPKDAIIALLQAQVASLKHDLGDRDSRLGVASVDYVKGLRDLANAYEALKPR